VGVILPFPLARRRAFVRRQAEWFVSQPRHAAEKNLRHQINVQADVLLRKGVAPEVVEREAADLERAIRQEAMRRTFSPRMGA
jgi:hypothetical protein